MRAVDLSVVAFHPDESLFARLLASIAEQTHGLRIHLFVLDNTPGGAAVERMAALVRRYDDSFATVSIRAAPANSASAAATTPTRARGPHRSCWC